PGSTRWIAYFYVQQSCLGIGLCASIVEYGVERCCQQTCHESRCYRRAECSMVRPGCTHELKASGISMQDRLPLPPSQSHQRQSLAIETLRTRGTLCCRDQCLYRLEHSAVGQGTSCEVRQSW